VFDRSCGDRSCGDRCAGPARAPAFGAGRAWPAVTLLDAVNDLERCSRGEGLMPCGSTALDQIASPPCWTSLPSRPPDGWGFESMARLVPCRSSRWGPGGLLAGAPDSPLEALISRARPVRLPRDTWPTDEVLVDRCRPGYEECAAGEVQSRPSLVIAADGRAPDCAPKQLSLDQDGARSTSSGFRLTGPRASWRTNLFIVTARSQPAASACPWRQGRRSIQLAG